MSPIFFQWMLVLLVLLMSGTTTLAADKPLEISGYTPDETMKLGERMYREGILPSGESVKAVVMGDIPVDGRIFTCDDCHQRSGLGSVEGTIITWPTNGKELYQPRRRTGAYRPPADSDGKKGGRRTLPKYYQMEDVRPAYTDESLSHLLRTGIDPAGRQIDPVMPLYLLDKKDDDILIHYLKNLSVELSPGVDEKTLYFATVIGAGVIEEEKQSMLSVLQAHIDARNTQTRPYDRRASSGPFYKTEMHRAYRRLDLAVWQLHGPEETWRGQLESYYRQHPVFALLGGISAGSWQPIHDFSEDHKIPAIFPITDLPVISDSDWYTLYFSKGYYQEGESAARYVRAVLEEKEDSSVVQLFRPGREGKALARGFRQTWEGMGGATPRELVLKEDGPLAEQLLGGQSDLSEPSVLLLWLGSEDQDLFRKIARQMGSKTIIFASSTLLKNNFSIISDDLRDAVHITYPYILPDAKNMGNVVVNRWLQLRHIVPANFTTQAKMYFLGWMLPGALKSMRSEFFREYFVEGFDMMTDQDYAIAVYPRLTFGQGQRYASKGCYIVKLARGPDPGLLPVSDWVIH